MILRTSRGWLILGGLLGVSCVPPESGRSGSGGAHGTGGASGTGGSVGTGGSAMASSGGAPGTGGSISGTGGNVVVSSGGATGTGGVSTTGSGGATGGARTGGSAGGVVGGAGRGGITGGGSGGSTGTGGSVVADPGSEGDGDITVGPNYSKQSDLTSKGAPAGKSFNFTMNSTDSQFYKGTDSTLLAANQHSFTRRVDVYVPAKYKDGTAAPFIVIQDGPGALGNVKVALDNLTASTDPARRLPAFIAIALASGGGDSLGSERGLEYDTMSDRYARFVDAEILPAVLSNTQIKAAYPNLAFTTDPEGRAAVGCSSGGAAAMAMGWFRPDLFRRIIAYSGTFVDQQDTDAPEEKMYPFGAWEYHSGLSLIANTNLKPLRVIVNANEMDNMYTASEASHHNWLLANQRMGAALKAKGYHYQFIFGMGAGHCDGKVQDATLADALVWLWRGYPVN